MKFRKLKTRVFCLLLSLLFSAQAFAQCESGGEQEGAMGGGGDSIIEEVIKDFIEFFISIVHAVDPNDITGPKGYAEKH